MARELARIGAAARRHLWQILGILWIVGLGLGYVGLSQNARSAGIAPTPLDLAYGTLQLTVLESGAPPQGHITWPLNVARFLLPALAAWTAVRALLSLFRDRWQHLLLRFWQGHVIICGLSRKGWLLAQGFATRGNRVVVVEVDGGHELTGPCRQRGIVVLVGDATDPDILRRAGVQRATHLVAVTDDDGSNAEIAVRCQELLQTVPRHRPYPLTCAVHVVDPQLYELARTREMALEAGLPLRLELFNVFERAARSLWRTFGPANGTAPAAAPHIVVIGLGYLGRSLVVAAARDWHTRLHSVQVGATGRLRITAIDLDASRKCSVLTMRYPQLTAVCDLVSLDMNVHGPRFFEAAFVDAEPGVPASVAFVCFDSESLSLSTALLLHQRLRASGHPTQVVVRMVEESGLARLVGPDEAADGPFRDLHAFGLLDRTCTPENILGGTHEVLAQGLYEATERPQRPADPAEVVEAGWNGLTESQRERYRTQADAIVLDLSALGYALAPLADWGAALGRLDETAAAYLARREHERRVTEGARRPSRNGRSCQTPEAWDALTDDARARACEAASHLPATLARAGYQIVPRTPDN